MVDIPIAPSGTVQSQVNPTTYQDAPRPYEIEKAMGGELGPTFSNVGQALDHIQQADGKSQALNITTQADLDLQQQMIQAKQTAAPGAAGFTDNMVGAVKDYYNNAMEGVNNPYAQQIIQAHAAAAKASFGEQAQNYEAQQQVALRVQNNDSSVNNMEKSFSIMAPADADAQYPMQMQKIKDVLASQPMDPQTRQKSLEIYQQGLQRSVLMNMITQDPSGFLQKVSSIRTPGSIAADPGNTTGLATNNPGNLTAPAGAFGENNPGNIKDAPENPWQGKTGVDQKGFVQFDTPQNGLRALAMDLRNKGANDGIDTVSDLVDTYAPPGKDNPNNANYKASLASALGVKPDDTIDLTNPNTLQKIMPALIKFEHGKNPYGDNMIQDAITGGDSGTTVVKGATGNDSIAGGTAQAINTIDASNNDPATMPNMVPAKTGIKSFDDASYADQQNYIAHAEDLQRRQQTGNIKTLYQTVNGNILMATQGITSQDQPTTQDFKSAYGQDWQSQYQDYQDRLQTGKDSYALQTMPNDQQALISAHYHSMIDPADATNFAENTKRAQIIDEAIATSQAARTTDPVNFQKQLKMIPSTPLNWNDPQQVNDRVLQAQAFAKQFNVPIMIADKGEAAGLGQMLKSQSADRNSQLLQSLADNVKNPYALSGLMQQLAPQQPEMAYAGMMMSLTGTMKNTAQDSNGNTITTGYTDPGDAARDIVKGLSLVAPSKDDQKAEGKKGVFVYPEGMDNANPNSKEPSFVKDWNAYVGNAFDTNPEGQSMAFKAAKAIYAAKAADGAPMGVYSSTIGQAAIKEAIGNVADQGSGKVLIPYGMDASTFKDSAQKIYNATIGKQDGMPSFDAADLVLTNTPGIYNIRNGTALVQGLDGQNATLDINNAGVGGRGHFIIGPASHNYGARATPLPKEGPWPIQDIDNGNE